MHHSSTLSSAMALKFFLFLSLVVVSGEDAVEKVWENKMFKFPDLRTICANFKTAPEITRECEEQLEIVCGNLTLLLTMLDASSTFPYTGLGYAAKEDYGNFEQCMTIDHRSNGTRILGEHCTSGLLVPDVFLNISDISTYFRLAVCKPNKCTSFDYNQIVYKIVRPDFPGFFEDFMCQTKESYRKFTAGDIATSTLLLVFIKLMIISTIYDIYIYKNHIKCHHPLLLAFSVLTNGRKLLHISKRNASKEHIEPFHGIRVISMTWIVAGHTCVGYEYIAETNEEVVKNWIYQRSSGFIAAAPLAVDTFFFMSGFLLAFQYLKHKNKSLVGQVSAVPRLYLHRYLRLTSPLFMVFLVTITLFVHMGSGPLWPSSGHFVVDCRRYWWSFFLYIQNYNNYNNLCLSQTWYLSADMQMFFFSPILLIPLAVTLKNTSRFKLAMAGLLVVNIITTFLPMVIKLKYPHYSNDYDTHSVIINYTMGIALATFMREKLEEPFLYMFKERYRSSLNLVLWILVILGLLATVVCYQEVEINHGYNTKSVFYSLMRPAWCTGLSWIVYSCCHGYGGFVNWILCRPTFQILGRLSYCIYLTHASIIIYYAMSVHNSSYFSGLNAFYVFCGHYALSLVVATFWTLAFESPLMTLEKFFMPRTEAVEEQKPEPSNANTIEACGKGESPNGNAAETAINHTEVSGVYKKSNEV